MCPSNVTIMASSVCVYLAVLGVVSAGVYGLSRDNTSVHWPPFLTGSARKGYYVYFTSLLHR